MAMLITIIVKWISHKLLILAAILAVLLAGAWVKAEWSRLAADQRAITAKEKFLQGSKSHLEEIEKEMTPKLSDWDAIRNKNIREAQKKLDLINAKIQETDKIWLEKIKEFETSEKTLDLLKLASEKAKFKKEELAKSVGWWQKRTKFFSKENRKKILQYEAAKTEAALKSQAYITAMKTHSAFKRAIEKSPSASLQKEQKERSESLLIANNSQTDEEKQWNKLHEEKNEEIRSLRELIDEETERVSKDPKQRFIAVTKDKMPTALGILLGVIITPILIKLFFYYVLAPLTGKLPAISLPNQTEGDIPTTRSSAVSLPFDVDQGKEILVHSDYLQSSSQPALKDTKWLLNGKLPFSSIASGMFFLTRIRPTLNSSTHVVVSSQSDAFGEIGVVSLPIGSSMIIQPRSLAGIVKSSGSNLTISRHWRLTSLHAWLTLQLRFLVFHGPCDLILKGCRGVKGEQPDPEKPRMINQASTIGFSTSLQYHSTRCETFISYLTGKEDLFNDLFSGDNGLFIYEEMPTGGRKTGLTGRGLEGVLDASLKIFGV